MLRWALQSSLRVHLPIDTPGLQAEAVGDLFQLHPSTLSLSGSSHFSVSSSFYVNSPHLPTSPAASLYSLYTFKKIFCHFLIIIDFSLHLFSNASPIFIQASSHQVSSNFPIQV